MLTPTNDYRARLGLSYDPSRFQVAIFNWVVSGTGHGVVEAVAGSGKTATLVACARLILNGLFVAFNRHIAEELGERLNGTGMVASTVHSLGRRVVADHLGWVKVERNKYKWVVEDYLVKQLGYQPKSERLYEDRRLLVKLADLVRLNLIDPRDTEAVQALCVHHDIPINGLTRHLPAILQDGEDRARNGRHLIDFTDMIYLPVKWQLTTPKFDWLFVDECQDLNRCQLEFILMCRSETGRMLFVGDRYQAIYGFAGADADSFLNIIARTQAEVLPLSICYRCPQTVIDLVKRYDHLSHIEARPGAPEGDVRYVKNGDLYSELTPGDLILCRVNAPIISLCIKLITRGVQARVKGRDIGAMLCEVIDDLTRFNGYSYAYTVEFLEDWRDAQYAFLNQKDADEGAYERVDDKVDAITACVQAFPQVTTPAGLKDQINGLFSDDRPSVWLSSVHKAKGLENPRVYIQSPNKLPLVWADQQEWERQQELNLVYVAYTRAQQELIFIEP